MSHRQLSHTWLAFVGLVGGVLLAACAHMDEYRRPETAVERTHSVESAVADIVGARCELEEHCRNVGPGQKFDSQQACESKLQGETAVALNIQDCPGGVERRKLDACISSILAQDC